MIFTSLSAHAVWNFFSTEVASALPCCFNAACFRRFSPTAHRELVQRDAAPSQVLRRFRVVNPHAHHHPIVLLERADLSKGDVFRKADEVCYTAATAREAGTRAFYVASKENIQVHGGMGFTWEGDGHLYYRRAKHLALMLGAAPEWKEKLVSEIERRNAA